MIRRIPGTVWMNPTTKAKLQIVSVLPDDRYWVRVVPIVTDRPNEFQVTSYTLGRFVFYGDGQPLRRSRAVREGQ